jgi:hypothetical protein
LQAECPAVASAPGHYIEPEYRRDPIAFADTVDKAVRARHCRHQRKQTGNCSEVEPYRLAQLVDDKIMWSKNHHLSLQFENFSFLDEEALG